MQNAPKKHRLIPIIIVLIILVGGWFLLTRGSDDETAETEPTETQTFDRSAHSIDEPSSLWVVVNKRRSLPESYVPAELVVPDIPLYGPRDEENMQVDGRMVDDLKRLIAAAEAEGLNLANGSAYRSASYQSGIYNLYVERQGQEAADDISARPGHSEHQTGLAIDFVLPSGECFIERCFEDTDEGRWLQENAHQYGFILRYQDGTRDITGYAYEPWHFRYVGVELATELHDQGNPTLEEFFDLEPAPNY